MPMLLRISLLACVFLSSAGTDLFAGTAAATAPRVIISVRDQKLMVVENGQRAAVYPVSTSKFGLGDRWGSMATPLGWLQVAEKIGDHAPPGAVFHKRRFTGEILNPNAPGRDPIVTRIIWLRGLEPANAHAFNRCIYIHGTPEEKGIGKPASYGCIRMCSKDVTEVYAQLPIGALVRIIPDSLPKLPKAKGFPSKVIFTAAAPQKPAAPVVKSAATAGKADSTRKRVSTAARHSDGDA
jgi:lipoprotein-anchoring transpeptidase ErfK/SrfK